MIFGQNSMTSISGLFCAFFMKRWRLEGDSDLNRASVRKETPAHLLMARMNSDRGPTSTKPNSVKRS